MVETFSSEIIENIDSTQNDEIESLISEFSNEEKDLMNEINNIYNINISSLKNKELVENMFAKQTIKDFNSKTWEGYKLQEKREKRYEEDYKWLRTLAVQWFVRMVNNWDLLMIKKKVDSFNKRNKCNIPYEIIFLALAESWWKASAKSRVAWWYRQFTKSSARLFGLDPNSRNDKYKSTDAALRHFKQNINIINSRAKRSWITISDDVKRKYAFWMYNGSPKLVGKGFRWSLKTSNDDWTIANYFKYIDNNESENYVPRILAIRTTIIKAMPNLNNTPPSKPDIDEYKKTPADMAFEKYDDESEKLDSATKLVRLNEIEKKYIQEEAKWLISEWYLTNCLNIIKKEKDEIVNEKDNLDEIIQTWTFILEWLDKKEEYKVYSYIIMKKGSPDILKRKFIEKFPDTKIENLIVTNINWIEFDSKKEFLRNEAVFIKSRNLEKKQTVEFEDTKNKNSEWYKMFRYEVKKWDTPYGIHRRFKEWDQKNWDKYTKSTLADLVDDEWNIPDIIEIWDKVYIKVQPNEKKEEIIQKQEFEDTEQYNSEWFRLFRYEVKKWDTMYAIARKFNDWNNNNWNKYKAVDYLDIVRKDWSTEEDMKIWDKVYIKAEENK